MTLVDAAAHPVGATGDEIRRYMKEPWRSAYFPGPERYHYASPFGEYDDATVPSAGGLPGSDPTLLVDHLGVDAADRRVVLVPLTRGLLAEHGSRAAPSARRRTTGLPSSWLDTDDRFRGSIRVNPGRSRRGRGRDRAVGGRRTVRAGRSAAASRTIRTASAGTSGSGRRRRSGACRWRSTPTAARASTSILRLPGRCGTPSSTTRLLPFTAAYHLASLIAEGVLRAAPRRAVRVRRRRPLGLRPDHLAPRQRLALDARRGAVDDQASVKSTSASRSASA